MAEPPKEGAEKAPAARFVYQVKGAAAASAGPADDAPISPGEKPKFDPSLYSFGSCEAEGEESADEADAEHAAGDDDDEGSSSGVQPGDTAPQTPQKPAVTFSISPAAQAQPAPQPSTPWRIPVADFAAALAAAPAQKEPAWPDVARLLCELGVHLARQEEQQRMVLTELALLGERMKRSEAEIKRLAGAPRSTSGPPAAAAPAAAPVRVRRSTQRSWVGGGLCCGRADDVVLNEKDVDIAVAPRSA